VLTVKQSELAGRFDELYARLNPETAIEARQNKVNRLRIPR
jgi:hypothetical protein